MIVGVLEVFEAKRNELLGMAWGYGIFVDMRYDEFQISHWLSESVEFCLQQVELTNSDEGFVKVGDVRQLIHVLSYVADDLGVVDALIAQPCPYDQQFLM